MPYLAELHFRLGYGRDGPNAERVQALARLELTLRDDTGRFQRVPFSRPDSVLVNEILRDVELLTPAREGRWNAMNWWKALPANSGKWK